MDQSLFVDATSVRHISYLPGIFFGVLVLMAPIEVLTLPILCGRRVLMVVTFLFFFFTELNAEIPHKNLYFSTQPACSRLPSLW